MQITTKAEFVSKLLDHLPANTTKGMAEAMIEAISKATAKLFKEGAYTVVIPGIVRFEVVDQAARIGRDPRTGAAVDIPARKKLKARAVPALGRIAAGEE